MKTRMAKTAIEMVLILGMAGIARGTMVFQDTCDQDVRNYWADPWGGWNSGEGVNAVAWDTGKYVIGNGMGELYTKSDFSGAANGYTLSYTDLKYCQSISQYWTVYGPGGCALRTQGVGNPAKVVYNGTEYAVDAPVYGLNPSAGGQNSVTIQYEKIAADQHRVLITLLVGDWRDTGSGWHTAPPSQVLFDHTFSDAPDFATYGCKIRMTNAKWAWGPYSTEIDNITLDVVPEPATLGLLAAGGLMALLRRKR